MPPGVDVDRAIDRAPPATAPATPDAIIPALLRFLSLLSLSRLLLSVLLFSGVVTTTGIGRGSGSTGSTTGSG